MHVLTLTTNLRMPFMREYLLLHGLSDVSRQTCTKILKRWRLPLTACAYCCIHICMTLMCCCIDKTMLHALDCAYMAALLRSGIAQYAEQQRAHAQCCSF